MNIRRYTKTFIFRSEHWHPDSFWELRSERQGKDDEILVAMTTRTVSDGVDWAAVREAQKRGEPVEDIIASGISQETVMGTRVAALTHFTVAVGGPDFLIPVDFVKGEEHGAPERDAEGAYVPHPLAGQLMPVTPAFIGCLDPEELAAAERALNRAHAGRSDEDQESFRDEPAPVPGRSRSRSKDAARL